MALRHVKGSFRINQTKQVQAFFTAPQNSSLKTQQINFGNAFHRYSKYIRLIVAINPLVHGKSFKADCIVNEKVSNTVFCSQYYRLAYYRSTSFYKYVVKHHFQSKYFKSIPTTNLQNYTTKQYTENLQTRFHAKKRNSVRQNSLKFVAIFGKEVLIKLVSVL